MPASPPWKTTWAEQYFNAVAWSMHRTWPQHKIHPLGSPVQNAKLHKYLKERLKQHTVGYAVREM